MINEREALVAQIEEFKKDAMELWFVPKLAASYKSMDMFSYFIVGNNEVFFMREQARQLWSFWNKAKAQAVPEGYCLLPKSKVNKCINFLAIASAHSNNSADDENEIFMLMDEFELASESGAEG